MRRRVRNRCTTALVLGLLVFTTSACGRSDRQGSRTAAQGPCAQAAADLAEPYEGIVDSYQGKTIEQFATGGFFAAGLEDEQRQAARAEQAARGRDCPYGPLLARVIAETGALETSGAAAVAAKGLLIAQASNALFYGPGGAAIPPSLLEPEDPTSGVTAEEVDSVDYDALEGCAELSQAKATLVQRVLDEITTDPSGKGGFSPATSEEPAVRLEAAERRSECSPFELSTGLLSALAGVQPVGFGAAARYGEFVKDAWATVEERLVDVEVELSMTARPAEGRVGDEVRIDYEVINRGNVPLAQVQLLELDVKPVARPIALVAAGRSETVSETITLTEDDVPRREIRVELSARDPFGRQTDVGYQSLFVPVSES